jgi:hypothetical protein
MGYRERNRMAWVLLAMSLAISWAAYPQRRPCSEATVLVEVYGPQGQPAHGLQPNSFRAKHRGKTLHILKVTPWSGPARVVLLFDLSGSVAKLAQFERSIGLDIMRQAPAGTSLAMAVFGSHAEVVAPFSAGTATVGKEIGNLDALSSRVPKADRKTALYDAIEFAVGMFGHPRPGDTICVISDGDENASQISLQQVHHILLANRIRLFAVVLPEAWVFPRDSTPEEQSGPANLSKLVDTSGGVRYIINPSTPIERRLPPTDWSATLFRVPQQFDQLIMQGYNLEITLPSAFRKPERWKLEVVDASGKVDHQHFVAYPLLPPCEMKP